MAGIIQIENLSKQYASGTRALSDVSLTIEEGEIIALLGPNGAGKTTLISVICGLVVPTGGSVRVAGHDIVTDWRAARRQIGLVPQEIALDQFETVLDSVRFTRGLYGLAPDDAWIEQILRSLSLWDKRDAATRELSGGMKRRVLIAKALAHQPQILFLDEPTAGVDVELRRDMWDMIRNLRNSGVTIILTTHYIEEAEEMADRIGVINKGEIILVEEKTTLMQKLGKKQLTLQLQQPLPQIPVELNHYQLELSNDGNQLIYTFDSQEDADIAGLLRHLGNLGIEFKDLQTSQSSLEDIFVNLVGGHA